MTFLTSNDIPDFSISTAKICLWFVFGSGEQVTSNSNKATVISNSRNRKKQFAKKEADDLGFILLKLCFNSGFSFAWETKSCSSYPRALCTRRCTVTDEVWLSWQGTPWSPATTHQPFHLRDIRHGLCNISLCLTGRNLGPELQEHETAPT